MSFETKVQKYIHDQQLVDKGDRLLIACSGGIDSMGLVYLFKKLQPLLEVQLFVAHVDHMLRGETSAKDRQFVENFCRENGLPIYSTSIPIPRILQEEGGNSQAICRRERYSFFKEIMEKNHINKLVTAHHADDQLESILMALTRASSLNGIKGMYSKRKFHNGQLIRPFLSVTKNEIEEYLKANGGTYREDKSNLKDDYTRNRYRHHIVPILKKENQNVSEHVVQFCEYLQQDDEFLTKLAKERFDEIVEKIEEDEFILEITSFLKESVALQRRIILILLNYLYVDTTMQSYALTSSILSLCTSISGSATIHLPNDYVAKRNYGEVKFTKRSTNINETLLPKEVSINEWTQLNGIRIYIGEASKVGEIPKFSEAFYFNNKTISTPLFIRPRKNGDRILLKGMTEPKRVSRLFIDEKIPLHKRDHWPILVDNKDEVIAVLGIRVSKDLSKTKNAIDELILVISTVE